MRFERLLGRRGDRGLLLTVGSAWSSRLVTAFVAFASIRILSGFLGIEGYGAYAVVVGLTGWFALADFGFGVALQNHISACRVAGQSEARAIGATLRLLLRLSVPLIGAVILASFWVGPRLLAGFPGISRAEAIAAVAVLGGVGVASGVSSVVPRLFFAEHRGYVAHLIGAVTGIVTLVGLLILSRVDVEHKFVWAIGLYVVPIAVVPALCILPRVKTVFDGSDQRITKHLWRDARLFLLNSVLAAMVLNVDYIILSQTVHASEIAVYAVLARVYGLVFFVYNSLLQAYWPIGAEAVRRGDFEPLRGIAARCIGIGVLVVLMASAGLYLFLPQVTGLLAPAGGLFLRPGLIPFFILYWCIRVWSDTWATLILAAGKPLFLCLTVPPQAALTIALGYAGASSHGLPGLLVGSSAAFLLTSVWLSPAYLRRLGRCAAPSASGPGMLPG